MNTEPEGNDAPAPADHDSPKRQGDKLGIGISPAATASETGETGDSPKRHGDGLQHAVDEAAKR